MKIWIKVKKRYNQTVEDMIKAKNLRQNGWRYEKSQKKYCQGVEDINKRQKFYGQTDEDMNKRQEVTVKWVSQFFTQIRILQ